MTGIAPAQGTTAAHAGQLTRAREMARSDPPAKTSSDGWTPESIRPVQSRNPQSLPMASIRFAVDPVTEQPGQRLSTAQIDAIAPFLANEFRVSEQFAREQLAQVYLYVGGPAAGGSMVMTNGNHIFLPSERGLRRILGTTRGGKHLLVHELAHTMQWATYDGGNLYHSASTYQKGWLFGHHSPRSGSGAGPLIWGSAITGTHGTYVNPIDESRDNLDVKDRIGLSVAPAAALGVPVGLALGGAIDAARHYSGMPAATSRIARALPSNWNSALAGAAVVTAPMLLAGAYSAVAPTKDHAGVVGAGIGAVVSAAGLLALRRVFRNGVPPGGRAVDWAIAGGGVAGGALAGNITARASSNTLHSWVSDAHVVSMVHELENGDRRPSDFADGLHAMHWQEIDAETVAHHWEERAGERFDNTPFRDRVPAGPANRRNAFEWSVINPLLFGTVPAAIIGGGVLGARLGSGAVRNVRAGSSGRQALQLAVRQVASQRLGFLNSMGVGGAVTIVPLAFGAGASFGASALGLGSTISTGAGTAAGVAASGAYLTFLLGRSGRGFIQRAPGVLVGMAVAAPVSLLGARVAVNASKPLEREYLT